MEYLVQGWYNSMIDRIFISFTCYRFDNNDEILITVNLKKTIQVHDPDYLIYLQWSLKQYQGISMV